MAVFNKKDGEENKRKTPSADRVKELLEYKRDYVKFIEDNGRIRAFGLRPIKLFDYQKSLIHDFQNHRFNLILKARQLGVSTVVGAFLGTYSIFHDNVDIVIVAINEDVAKELILKTKVFIENLKPRFKPTILNPRNKESIEFKNGTRIMAVTSTSNAGRSFSAKFLVLDEAAFINNSESLWTSAYPSLSVEGNAIILSTPAEENTWFHKMCVSAENGDNEFKLTKLYWWMRPEYNNDRWKKMTIANLGDERRFEREYNCSFQSSANTVVSTKKINEILRSNATKNIRSIEKFKSISGKEYEELDIYEAPQSNKIYLIVADTAQGLGESGDASAFLIFNVTDNKIIGEYASKFITERLFSNIIIDIGYTYNTALILVEINAGALVSQYIIDEKYKNIFYSDRKLSLFIEDNVKYKMPNQYTSKTGQQARILPGFLTTSKNKVMTVNNMKNAIMNGEIRDIYTTKTLEQLKTYINDNGRYKARSGSNDDRVTCLHLGLWILKYVWKIIENNNLLNDIIVDLMTVNSVKVTDSKKMTEITAFSPIYNMKKFRHKMNPYNYGVHIGDVRCFFDKMPNTSPVVVTEPVENEKSEENE